MKKLLFVINHMNMGGIQKALTELLKGIDGRYDVYLLSIRPNGALLDEIPSNVHILKASKMLLASELSCEETKQLGIITYCMRIIASVWTKVFSKRLPAYIITIYAKKIGKV